MAGPSIVVRILGDLKGLGTAFDGATTKAQGSAKKAHAAFSGFLDGINKTGVLGPFGVALDGIDQAIGAVIEHGRSIGPMLAGAGAGIAGVGATLSMFGSKEQASHQQLSAAIDATGKSYDQYGGRIEAAIKHGEGLGKTSEETQTALMKLTQATHDPGKALDLLGVTMDVAASKHEDLSSAAGAVGKVYNGNTKLLKGFGIIIDKHTGKTKDNQDAMQALADVTKGQAAAAQDTFAGKMDAVKAKMTDAVSMFGSKYGPAIQVIGVAVMGLGSMWTMVSAMTWSAVWPVLAVVAAIAALALIAYVIYRNWGTIWGAMKTAVDAVWGVIQGVWHWIADNWPLLLAILFGPIGLAVAIIVTHFDTVKRVAKDAVDFIVSVWNGLVGFFSGIVATISGYFGGLWSGITGAASSAVAEVEAAWNGVVSWVTGLGGSITSAAAHIWDGMTAPFKAMVNGIAGIWNSTVGALHFDIPGWVPGVGGKGFSAPTIPTLAAGGLITSTGFVYAHAGEAISPIPSGLGGPSVVIENVNLGSDLEVDAFGRKLAWTMQTAGV